MLLFVSFFFPTFKVVGVEMEIVEDQQQHSWPSSAGVVAWTAVAWTHRVAMTRIQWTNVWLCRSWDSLRVLGRILLMGALSFSLCP